ncbi:Hypothetical protein NTJ_16036 [Nesidiocoris tenuis]|uniref:Uncharacterized protein n=1 Tax=Nesidiocoris tenuis TaxID=355587 RepID=A0ABN7BHA2_9HEMI|nr:Hypothetical protein NTJ_16036 [Nesidiocoris tenuis]
MWSCKSTRTVELQKHMRAAKALDSCKSTSKVMLQKHMRAAKALDSCKSTSKVMLQKHLQSGVPEALGAAEALAK